MSEFTWESAVVVVSVIVSLIILVKEWAGADFVFLGLVAVLMVTRIVSTDEGLEGFSNTAPLTVAVLFVVATGVSETGCLNPLFNIVLGSPSTVSTAVFRLTLPVTIISAFTNNTPLVAIMIPIVKTWCDRAGLPPGQLFIPLSFASILGGTCTLISTSTNLVVQGLIEKDGSTDVSFFYIGKFGVPVAISGIVYMLLFAPLLLPGLGDSKKRYHQSSFLFGMEVTDKSRAIGLTVDDAGLRGLKGLYLATVQRGQHVFSAVGPEFVIAENDILYFTGVMDELQRIAESYNLRAVTDENEETLLSLLGSPEARSVSGDQTAFDNEYDHMKEENGLDGFVGDTSSGYPALERRSYQPLNRLLQAKVVESAEVVGHSIKEINFRTKFQAAVLAVSRNGERVQGKFGKIVLEGGDVLVLDCSPYFDEHSDEVVKNLTDIKALSNRSEREFMVAMEVQPRGPLVSKTIEKAGLRGLPQLYLVEIERTTGHRIPAVSPTEVLHAGDVLWFSGVLESVAGLRKIPGLVPHGDQIEKLNHSRQERRLVEAVVSPHSVLVGKTVRESRFRTRFYAAIIGVHRQGHRLKEKIGDIVLRGGDVLLLDTGPNFAIENKNNRNFALVSEVARSHTPRSDRAIVAALAVIAMILSQLIGATLDRNFIDLITAALITAGVMLMSQCLTGEQARSSIQWDVIITIAAAFGVSNGIQNSNIANLIVDGLVSVGNAVGGDFFLMFAIYLATMLLSNLIANNAAAALMYPVAIGVAKRNGIRTQRMAALLMLGASAAFMTPFGYQTNLMVFASGGYSVIDFVKFGAPMQIWQMFTSLVVLFLEDYWMIVWSVAIAIIFSVFGLLRVKEIFFSTEKSQIMSPLAKFTSSTPTVRLLNNVSNLE